MQRHSRVLGFTLVELLVVIAIISLLAGLLVPTVGLARKKGQAAKCLSQLKELYKLGSIYAQDNRDRYPFDRSKKDPLAYESLQILADWNPVEVSPQLFCCPLHTLDDAAVRPEGQDKYVLDEASCSYTWVNQPTSLTDRSDLPLSSDDKVQNSTDPRPQGHDGGLNIVYVGGNAEFLKKTDIPEDRIFPKGLVGNTVK